MSLLQTCKKEGKHVYVRKGVGRSTNYVILALFSLNTYTNSNKSTKLIHLQNNKSKQENSYTNL